MSDDIFNRVFIHFILFRHGDKVYSSVMRPMVGVEIQDIPYRAKPVSIFIVSEEKTAPVRMRIRTINEIFTSKCFCFFIFSGNKRAYARVYGNQGINL